MKRSLVSVGIWAFVCAFAPAFVSGCGDASAEREARSGSATMALTGVSTSGKSYRLRNATLEISGTANATASSEDDLAAPTINVELKAGGYLAKLVDGWSLEVQGEDGTFSAIHAVLTSTNPLPFTVVDQQSTNVFFQFNAGDDVVQLGNGRAVFGIAVSDCSNGSCSQDQDGDGVSAPLDCDDTDATVFPGAIESCNGIDDNCDGATDEGGVCDGGQCDASPDCQSCQECAGSGPCQQQANGCFNDAECTGFIDCLSACADQACVDDCVNQFPVGVGLYNAVVQCYGCECANTCPEFGGCQ